MAPIMSNPPVVVQVHFRITDQFHEETWSLSRDLRFLKDYPELNIDKGDGICAVDGVDVRHKSAVEISRLLMMKKLTTFTSIRFIKQSKETGALPNFPDFKACVLIDLSFHLYIIICLFSCPG